LIAVQSVVEIVEIYRTFYVNDSKRRLGVADADGRSCAERVRTAGEHEWLEHAGRDYIPAFPIVAGRLPAKSTMQTAQAFCYPSALL
jgi:hypothetical protein